MVVRQYSNSSGANSMKTSRSDGDISLTAQTLGLGSLPARTRDSGVGASTSSDMEGVGTSPSTPGRESVAGFCSSTPNALLLSDPGGTRGMQKPKKPPVPFLKQFNRKPKTVNFKDDVDIVTVDSFAGMQTVVEELSSEIMDSQCVQCIPEVRVVDSCTLSESPRIHTKFPNSFVATRRKNILTGIMTSQSALSRQASETTLFSSISDLPSEIPRDSGKNEVEETSFRTTGEVEALRVVGVNGSRGHLLSRSSLNSTSSSSSSQSSRSSVATSASIMSSSEPSLGHSLMLLSPSSSSLSSSSSFHGVDRLEAPTSQLEDQGNIVPAEVPEYDAVGASSCDKCPEGKCRTVYLHVPGRFLSVCCSRVHLSRVHIATLQ